MAQSTPQDVVVSESTSSCSSKTPMILGKSHTARYQPRKLSALSTCSSQSKTSHVEHLTGRTEAGTSDTADASDAGSVTGASRERESALIPGPASDASALPFSWSFRRCASRSSRWRLRSSSRSSGSGVLTNCTPLGGRRRLAPTSAAVCAGGTDGG